MESKPLRTMNKEILEQRSTEGFANRCIDPQQADTKVIDEQQYTTIPQMMVQCNIFRIILLYLEYVFPY